ncbi:MAG: MATE family efflux transporter [Rhodobacteraceae bacterium]|uniref:MATE family efflux transporter n=1 Tax=Albidovulum sp. TaxID=1872424 RepID=UPI001D7C584B|nr:MATE family efflux transporter [Paracoccaceae bacterium]MCC0046563.1 MATE family efflux transporter [Defluviimonas sp.]HRV62480.1 MATE family efflux transporter [Albidovulum sp.]MCB2118301.1 MATE family efflux transporter [Paracoccaceae bacterium]MCB2133185.1 MATE family efflux transporter [Paracoccaceae bacterium]
MDGERDLTTGSIPGHFRALALPAAIGMVFSTLYNVVDVWYAGLLRTDAQAALAIGFIAFFILSTVGFGLGSAMGAHVGQAIGRKDRALARRMAGQGIVFGLLASVVLITAGLRAGPALIGLVSEPGPYRDLALSYFRVMLLAMPGFVLGFGVNGILQALGDTVSMSRAMIVAFFANLALDPLFMFGVPGVWGGIGFDGIAAATVVSQTGVLAFLLFRLLRRPFGREMVGDDFRPRGSAMRQIAVQMAPVSFAMAVMLAAGFIVQFYMKSFGPEAVAAYGLGLRVEQLVLLPAFGLTGALLPIAAQNFGAGHHERVRQALFDCWKIGLAYMAVACPLLWLSAHLLLGVFTDDPRVIEIGTGYLHVDVMLLPLYLMLIAANALLQALRRPLWTLWIGIYRQAVALAVFAWFFSTVLGLGLWGVWLGLAAAVVTGLALSLVVLELVAGRMIGGLFRVRHLSVQAATPAAPRTDRGGV